MGSSIVEKKDISDPEKLSDSPARANDEIDNQKIENLVAEDQDHEIQLRTMSWQKTAVLLFGEYVCLAIMSQAWSFSQLGYVGKKFIMRHPEVRDIVDIGYILFGRSPIVREITSAMLLLNNLMLMGFHVLTGAEILNTLSDHSQCTAVFSVVVMIISIILSLPRTLNHVSTMSIGSAICMFLAILLGLIFVGIQDQPSTYPELGEVSSKAVAPSSTTFVSGLNAALNITFLWVGQILYPTFISEMKNPRDFPKALAALSIAEFVLFAVPAIVAYRYAGQYSTAPVFGTLDPTYKKISFGLVIVPTVIIGGIYSNVTCKYIYRRILGDSRHAHSNTLIGWGTWVGVVIAAWAVAFVFGSTIPSFGDFISIMSATFDSFFGFIFWSVAWFTMNKGRLFATPFKSAQTILAVILFVAGCFMLGPGLYSSVTAIKADYAGPVSPAFSCADNGI